MIDVMKPTRDGYIFKGWATVQNATEPNYMPGAIYSLNQDITLYAVWETALYLKSNTYLIANEKNYTSSDTNQAEYEIGDTYIFGLKPGIGVKLNQPENRGTDINELKKNIETNADNIEVIKEDNSKLGSDELIGTGMKIVFTKGDQKIEVVAIVMGDNDGDGILKGSDQNRARYYVVENDTSRLTTLEQQLSLDVNLDGNIRGSDISLIRSAIEDNDNTKLGV
jgi:uncharacterized repeat protein (TIGR02543 family)